MSSGWSCTLLARFALLEHCLDIRGILVGLAIDGADNTGVTQICS
jgi:hypothetical protein